MARAILVGVLTLITISAAGETPSLKQLYDEHEWFELRGATAGREPAPLYAGAAAAAFNNAKSAQKYLKQAIEPDPNADTAKEAHERLAELYGREGKYKETVHELDAVLRIRRDPGTENVRALFAAWGSHADQTIGSVRPGKIHADVRKDGVRVPIVIHGQTVHWLLDTGANFSLISESEARRLGMVIDNSSENMADPAGGSTKIRTAVVDELTIGDVHIRNFAFMILSDAQEPMTDWQRGEQGVIGLPLVIALQSIAWRSDGTFQIGEPHHSQIGRQNLSFDGFLLVTRTQLEGQPSNGTDLDFVLDTGNQSGTQLWGRFSADFAALLAQRGKVSRQTINMVGGSNERETVMLPELQLRVGGLDASLRPAQVYPKPVGDDLHYGLLGMDVLSQAREVRIDLTKMRLDMLP